MKPADRDDTAPVAAEDGVGTRALLESFTVGDPEEVLPLGAMFGGLGKRSFGMLVFIAILPSFLPIPGIGGASGLLVVMLGLQLMAGLRVPWLPGFVARRGPTRRTIGRFRDRIAPWLARLERLSRPRAPAMLERRLANIFTGLLLVALGCLLCLPIPFTNYLFGVLLLLFALALLERDGYLMILAWLAGTAAVVFFSLISGQLATMIAQWIHG
ncbi:exopolysaccharide biosynthesis protein [Lysobacter sp. A03]|uniref:exopolysaccharide biosynthesis protein n=1 Tax=Lysobacter sp. A03 TaxID=1199154 RepID=UPI0005C6F43D|nr:exopolysaccharide biosynthesis protein [Lysobacter sp. A03]